MIKSYYKFMKLPEEVRKLYKIKSKKRFDCVGQSDIGSKYKGLHPFYNNKNQLFLYMDNSYKIVDAEVKRRADYTLTGQGMNFSSIYIEDLEYPTIGYGTPNANQFLKNGEQNPMYQYSNDGYIFYLNKDYTQLEVLVFEDSRHLIGNVYQVAIDGGFNDKLEELRQNIAPVYNYEGLSL